MLRGVWKAFNNARAVVLAVIVHVAAIGILIVNMEWTDVKPAATPKAAPIQTKTVERKLAHEEHAEDRLLQQQVEKEKRRLAEAEKKRKLEEKRRKELAAKQQRGVVDLL